MRMLKLSGERDLALKARDAHFACKFRGKNLYYYSSVERSLDTEE